MGLPIHAAGELVAMVGVANRPGGYSSSDVHFLQPLLNSVGQLEMARRAEIARRDVEFRLAQTSVQLEEKTHLLELTLGSVSQGIAYVDKGGRVRIHNQRYLDLLDLPRELLEQQPLQEDVVRYQAQRGDFRQELTAVDAVARDYLPSVQEAQAKPGSIPEVYLRRTPSGRYLEARTRMLHGGGFVRTYTDVTDYLATQEALGQNEARWRSLTQLSSDWYWEQDEHFRFVHLAGNTPSGDGISDEAHYGLARWELPGTLVGEAQWRAHRAQLEAHEVFHDFEMQRRVNARHRTAPCCFSTWMISRTSTTPWATNGATAC